MKSEEGTMPDFIGIGFQKCGTTTMYDLLFEHPGVVMARDVKEPMFYRVPAMYHLFWHKRKKWYSWRYFGHIQEGETRLVGEVNAGYGYKNCGKMLTRDFDHDTKLFFMMRNPVDRAYSAFKYFTALGFLPRWVIREDLATDHATAFDHYTRYVLAHPRRREKIPDKRLKYLVFSQGNYADLAEEYDAFPHRHYILFEEFVRDEQGECEKLYDFLGLEHPQEGIPYGLKANEGNLKGVNCWRVKMRWWVKAADYVWDEFIAVSHWWPRGYQKHRNLAHRLMHTCTRPDTDKSRMLPQTRKLLEDYYRPQKERLARILGRDLDEIWYK